MKVQPYLMFDGRCDEAIAFYERAVGLTVQMRMLFKESPDQSMVRPEMADRVMHAELRVGDTTFFASDGHCTGMARFSGFSMNVQVATDAEADDVYAKLAADGGQARMPPTKTFWSSKFGMLTDRFGVDWMVLVQP